MQHSLAALVVQAYDGSLIPNSLSMFMKYRPYLKFPVTLVAQKIWQSTSASGVTSVLV